MLTTGGTAASYDAADQFLTYVPPGQVVTSYTYVAKGSRLSEVSGTNRTTHTWDARNRLDHTEYPGNVRVTNVDDFDGLRRKMTGPGGTVTLTHWDQQVPFLQTDGSGASKNEQTHVPSEWGGNPVAARVSGASFYPTFDELGSLRAEIDAAPLPLVFESL